MRSRVAVVVAGPVAVTLYAAMMVLVIRVWDPTAAVPFLDHASIIERLGGSNPRNDYALALPAALAGAGVLLTLVVSGIGALGFLTTKTIVVLQLTILGGGAPAYFVASFPLGMDVADTFGVSGGAHTPWTGVLYLVSLAGFVAAAGLASWPARVTPLQTRSQKELIE